MRWFSPKPQSLKTEGVFAEPARFKAHPHILLALVWGQSTYCFAKIATHIAFNMSVTMKGISMHLPLFHFKSGVFHLSPVFSLADAFYLPEHTLVPLRWVGLCCYYVLCSSNIYCWNSMFFMSCLPLGAPGFSADTEKKREEFCVTYEVTSLLSEDLSWLCGLSGSCKHTILVLPCAVWWMEKSLAEMDSHTNCMNE